MSRTRESLANALDRIERLASALGVSRIAVIALAGAPSSADRIAAAFVEGVVTLNEAREMIAEARLTAPGRREAVERVLPRRTANG